MQKRKLIGFSGRKRSGKTCLANYLKQNSKNATIITIADYLKHLCCEIMGITYDELNIKKDNGETFDVVPDDKWFNIIENSTHIGIDNIKKELKNRHITNIRQLLQVIGTDVIRKYDENWHVKQMVAAIEQYPQDMLLIVDDVRFPNEKEAITKLNGEVFFIVRPNITEVSNHPSETALKWQDFNINNVIINDRDKEGLQHEFLIHFYESFKLEHPYSIFLHENQRFLPCANFGFDTKEDDELLIQLLRQLKTHYLFTNYGLIVFKTCSKQLTQRYIKEIDRSLKHIDSHCNEFITDNPLITENLKKYL